MCVDPRLSVASFALYLSRCFFRSLFAGSNRNTARYWIAHCSAGRRHLDVIPSVLLLLNVKFTLEQAMKAQRGSRGIALLFL
jgi:hypothetical protein